MAATAQPRRTQRERREATTAALLAAARRRFAADGYAATSLDAIAADAGVTKGALYHHFEGKDAVFASVFDAEQRRLCDRAAAALERGGLAAACVTWLEAAREPAAQRITLVDAPLALSATTLRTTPMLGLIERALADAGHRGDVGALAQLVHGALREAALALADDPSRHDAIAAELRGLLRVRA